jgi:hypothetical protein
MNAVDALKAWVHLREIPASQPVSHQAEVKRPHLVVSDTHDRSSSHRLWTRPVPCGKAAKLLNS